MSTVDLVPLLDEGLGNSAYLVDLGDGRALVVDVSLDLRAAQQAGCPRRRPRSTPADGRRRFWQSPSVRTVAGKASAPAQCADQRTPSTVVR